MAADKSWRENLVTVPGAELPGAVTVPHCCSGRSVASSGWGSMPTLSRPAVEDTSCARFALSAWHITSSTGGALTCSPTVSSNISIAKGKGAVSGKILEIFQTGNAQQEQDWL